MSGRNKHLVVFNSIPVFGGGEKRLLAIASHLGALGWDVTFVVRGGSPLGTRAKNVGCEVVEVDFRDAALAADRGFAVVDVVVAGDRKAGRAACAAVQSMRSAGDQVRFIYYYGLEASLETDPRWRAALAVEVDKVVVNASFLQQEVVEAGVPPHKCLTIRSGFRRPNLTDRNAARASLRLPDGTFLAMAAGRLVEDKQWDMLLDVATGLRSPAVQFLIAGDGPSRSRLEQEARSRGLDGSVRFVGYQRDLDWLLMAADCLVHPSPREGMPNVVGEAMAAGLPVVCRFAPGTAELVGESGALCATSAEMTSRVRDLLTDRSLRRQQGAAAVHRIETDFSYTHWLEQWVGVLYGSTRVDVRG